MQEKVSLKTIFAETPTNSLELDTHLGDMANCAYGFKSATP
jgi:hypothetical protein